MCAQSVDKKLLLVLTDGQPADIDVKDERLLIEDAKVAVRGPDFICSGRLRNISDPIFCFLKTWPTSRCVPPAMHRRRLQAAGG